MRPPTARSSGAYRSGSRSEPSVSPSEPVPPPLPVEALEEAAGARLSPDEAARLMEAVKLGRRGWGAVHPNPLVGCVLVRGGEEVGRGWHRAFGGPHAEVEALEAAGEEKARGATALVSLEPCAHRGKTGPCTLALREAGVARVVYGAADPTRKAGGGGRELREAGIDVVGPLFSPELSRHLNPAFFHRAGEPATPYLAVKLAMTLDGKIAAGEGERTPITGEEAGRYTHRLRAGFDGILVGAGTVRADDPLLTVRRGPEPRVPPRRLILDTRADALRPGAALLRDADAAPVHLFCGPDASRDRVRALEEAGATVHRVSSGSGGVELAAVLRVCWEEGIASILCEGGGRTVTTLLNQGLARRLYLYLSPNTLGPEGVPGFPEGASPEAWPGWRASGSHEKLGRDALIVFDREP